MNDEESALFTTRTPIGLLRFSEKTPAERTVGVAPQDRILQKDTGHSVGITTDLADLRSGIFPAQLPRPLPRILAVFELLRVDLEVLQNLEEHGVEVGGVEGGGLRGHGGGFCGEWVDLKGDFCRVFGTHAGKKSPQINDLWAMGRGRVGFCWEWILEEAELRFHRWLRRQERLRRR